jgi:serine/threonine protein kinase
MDDEATSPMARPSIPSGRDVTQDMLTRVMESRHSSRGAAPSRPPLPPDLGGADEVPTRGLSATRMERTARTRMIRRPPAQEEEFDFDFSDTVHSLHCETILFDRFKTKRILGRGGMGVVWLAEDLKLKREVALKFMPEMVAMDVASLNDLRKETRLGLLLSHQNVVQMIDLVEGETAAIVMEFVEGSTLAALRLEQPGEVFDVSKLRTYVMQLLDALEYAHTEVKLVHRDLKPSNLMVNNLGQLKVADFGIASCVRESVSRMSLRAVTTAGTLVYVSPQQRMGEIPKYSDDIYSLGATIYELLTGRPPFYAGDIGLQIAGSIPPLVSERRKEFGIDGEPVPRAWDEVIAACLEKDPADRPANIAAIRDGLNGQKFMHGSGKVHQHQPTRVPRNQPKAASSVSIPPWVWAPVAAGILLVGLGFWNFGVRVPEEERKNKAAVAEKERRKAAETARLAEEQKRREADKSLAEHKATLEEATVREAGLAEASAKKALWIPLQINLAEYDYPYGDDEIRLRAEVAQKVTFWQEREAADRVIYEGQLAKMTTEFQAVETETARPDLGAGPKRARWQGFLGNWRNQQFPAGFGDGHNDLISKALLKETHWAGEEAKETPAQPVGYPQCFADSTVASWNVSGKKAALRAVQDALITGGYFKQAKADGVYTPALHLAILEFQRAKQLPVTGKLDQFTLKAMNIPTDKPPTWGLDEGSGGRSSTASSGGSSSSRSSSGSRSNSNDDDGGGSWWDRHGDDVIRAGLRRGGSGGPGIPFPFR